MFIMYTNKFQETLDKISKSKDIARFFIILIYNRFLQILLKRIRFTEHWRN